jgi:hypothetical protein
MLTVHAPTDAQLDLIANLCEERGWFPPAVIASKQEASEIISRILSGTYEADDYIYPFGWEQDLPFDVARFAGIGDDFRETDADLHAEDVWHQRYDGTEDVQR